MLLEVGTVALGSRDYYFTACQLSAEGLGDLDWLEQALNTGVSCVHQKQHFSTLAVTWGDGSGTGCGGTFNLVNCDNVVHLLHTWLGVWSPTVHHFSANWKEMHTLKASLQNIIDNRWDVSSHCLWYLTDNQCLYDIFHRGYSSSPLLHSLLIGQSTNRAIPFFQYTISNESSSTDWIRTSLIISTTIADYTTMAA